VNVPATLAVGLVVLLFGVALLALSGGDFRLAGFSFLTASLVLYVRETYLTDA
jgi:glucose dehydrogenase